MKTSRFIGTCAVAFVVSQVLAVIFFGVIMGADYQPFRGTLLRAMNTPEWPAIFLPVAHLSFVSAFVWIYVRVVRPGPQLRQGVALGVMAWLMCQLPQWLIWYAEQPWPGRLIVKQLALDLVSALAVGVVVSLMYRPAEQSTTSPRIV
jgi:hypothetical protein